MTAIVFAGPSLWPAPPPPPGVIFRPPAACGEIARAVRERPRAIGLVDGFFGTTASPWHKEILWGLSRGVAIYGAASMGALRAAELAPFGMRGTGRIFQDYITGAIDADDEVAVLHGPAEMGWPPLTTALVDIRATLAAARLAGIIGRAAADRLLALARDLFYKDRTWERLLSEAGRAGPFGRPLRRLEAWLPVNAVSAKRRDALELIEAVAAHRPDGTAGAPTPFVETTHFRRLMARVTRR